MGTYRMLLRLLGVVVLAAACEGKDPVKPPVEQHPQPVLTGITPTLVTAGDPEFTLVVTGTSFVAQSNVRWNGTSRPTTFASATQLNALISASDIAAAGSGEVTVHSPLPGGGTSSALTLQIQTPNAVPTVTALTPALVPAGGLSLSLTVTGTGFVEGAQVHWDGSARATVVSSTQVTALIGPADLATGRIVSITVANPAPGGGSSAALPLQVVPTVLAVTSNEDVSDGRCTPEHCSLREAMELAHALPVAGRRIEIGSGQITLTGPLPTITESLEIVGQGPAQVTIHADASAGNERRIFTITGTASVMLSGMTLSGGYQPSGGAIAVVNDANLTLTNAVLTGNQAPDVGGGAMDVTTTGALRIEDVTFSHNHVSGNPLTGSASAGALAVRREGAGDAAQVVVLRNVTFHDNEAVEFGGALLIRGHPNGRTLDNVVVRDNRAGASGGGAYFTGPGTFDIISSTFDGNSAGSNGGGINAVGGALGAANDAVLRISNSTISNNASQGEFGVQGGGGIFHTSVGSEDRLFITNSTFSGNRARMGGALNLSSSAVLTNVTIVGNTASSDVAGGGGIALWASNRVTRATNVLLAGNLHNGAPQNCWVTPGQAFTRIESLDGNLSNDASCASYFTETGDMNSTAAGLSPILADNGGPTLTHALLAGSAAIDAGNAATCSASDQRGYARQGACDVGAFEFNGVPAGGAAGLSAPRRK